MKTRGNVDAETALNPQTATKKNKSCIPSRKNLKEPGTISLERPLISTKPGIIQDSHIDQNHLHLPHQPPHQMDTPCGVWQASSVEGLHPGRNKEDI